MIRCEIQERVFERAAGWLLTRSCCSLCRRTSLEESYALMAQPCRYDDIYCTSVLHTCTPFLLCRLQVPPEAILKKQPNSFKIVSRTGIELILACETKDECDRVCGVEGNWSAMVSSADFFVCCFVTAQWVASVKAAPYDFISRVSELYCTHISHHAATIIVSGCFCWGFRRFLYGTQV